MMARAVKLLDVLEVQSGFAFKTEFFSGSEGVPLIRIRDLDSSETETRYRGEFRPEFLVQPGDYLIGMDGNFRCRRWKGTEALLNQRVCRLHRFSPEVLPEYVFYGIQPTLEAIEAATPFATVKHISTRQILDIELPIPPIDEQRRIVDLLSRAEGIVRLRREAQAKAQAIIPALFLDMFGDPATNPKHLPTATIDSLCTLVRGSSPRPQGDPRFFGGAVPRLMIADISRDGVYVTPRIDSLTEEGALKSRPMKAGEVVMAVSGAVGLPAILAIDACIHDGFVGFRALSNDVSPVYFYNYLRALRRVSESQAVGATFQNLKTDQIRAWQVPLPSSDDQQRFVQRAMAARAIEGLQGTALSRAELVFQSLLTLAFGGRQTAAKPIPQAVDA